MSQISMSIGLQIIIILLSVSFLLLVMNLVSKGRLQLKYSLLWIVLTIACMVGALFPNVVFSLSKMMGFLTPSNFVFVVALFFLLAICLSLSGIVSKQAQSIKNLTQEVALLKHKLNED